MAVERADLSTSLKLEPMAPVSTAPAVQNQASPEEGEGKPRRRPPPPEVTEAESSDQDTEKNQDEGKDRPQRRIDSLA